jgi:two-component system, sensor histidine kinase
MSRTSASAGDTPAQADLATATPERDAEHLLQELQTHQIELETQNAALRESEIALAESRDRYVDLYDFSPIGYLTLTHSALIAEVNLTGAALLGSERNRLRQRRFASFVVPEDRERWDRQFVAALRGEKRQRIGVSLRRMDGKNFNAQLDCLRIGAANGTPVLRIALTDVSDSVQHWAELDRARTAAQFALKAAEQANGAKSRFLAAASHDLRQPLSALSIYVNLFKAQCAPADRALAANMQECIGSLNGLLTNLLDLSKLEAGVVKSNMSAFAIADILASLESIHAPGAQQKGLKLRCVATRCIGYTDPVLFKRLLGNLIDNAIRYTERGGICIGCRRRDGKTWVEVWDSGIGIPADRTTEIFEEFTQLGDSARNGGSGLGLAIVAKTAALLGLEIRVASKPRRGSMFAVELPPGRQQPAPAPAPDGVVCRSLRVALVEDNAMVRQAFALALEAAGHQVIAAASGAALLARLDGVPMDIVVSDYRLALGETGFDVIAATRAATKTDLPALLITGDTDPQLLRRMADQDIVVLHKPVDLETLLAHLDDLAQP